MKLTRLKVKLLSVAFIPLNLIGFTACDPGLSSTNSSQNTNASDQMSMKTDANIRFQSVSFKWQGQTLTHDYVCAPTKFPPFKIGGGDPFSGGASGKGRGAEPGWSPIPQWQHIETKAGALLIRLACEGQWHGLEQLSGSDVASVIEVFTLKNMGGVAGLSPAIVSDITTTDLKKIQNEKIVSDQIKKLKPLTGILRAYPEATLADPVLISLGKILPPKEDRPFQSKPWMIKCGTSVKALAENQTSSKESAFTLPGQPALSASSALKACQFVEYLDINSMDYKDRPRSPYPDSVLHLISESGEEVFIEARHMTLRNPQLFMHANDKGSFRGALERDPFLDTEFFKKNAVGLTAFETRP